MIKIAKCGNVGLCLCNNYLFCAKIALKVKVNMSINIFGFKTIIVNDTQVTSDNYIDIFILMF